MLLPKSNSSAILVSEESLHCTSPAHPGIDSFNISFTYLINESNSGHHESTHLARFIWPGRSEKKLSLNFRSGKVRGSQGVKG